MQKNTGNPNYFKRKSSQEPQKNSYTSSSNGQDNESSEKNNSNAHVRNNFNSRYNNVSNAAHNNYYHKKEKSGSSNYYNQSKLQDKPQSTVVSVPSLSSNHQSERVNKNKSHVIPYPNRLKNSLKNQQAEKHHQNDRNQIQFTNRQTNNDKNQREEIHSTSSGYSTLTGESMNIDEHYSTVPADVFSTHQDSEYNSEDYGDLDKLQSMTAVEFDIDRYARFGVHESEIKDYVRTITYKNCIEYCTKEYIKDKVVLVVRCGIGLLPLFCVRIGCAKRVIALEQSACIEYARRIINDNMFNDKITLIQKSVNALKKLPHGLSQVDVIISDFMGDCVMSQGDEMEQVVEARDRFLKPNGLMIPMFVTLYAQLLEQRQAYENRRIRKNSINKIKKKLHNPVQIDQSLTDDNDSDSSSDSTWCTWWKNVYGFDMRSKAEFIVDRNTEYCSDLNKEWCVMPEPIVTFFDPCKVVSSACILKEFDMYKCTIEEVRHVHCKDLKLKCTTPNTISNRGDYAHMLELFMVVDFPNGKGLTYNNDGEQIGFSTSSLSPQTRYRQTGLLLRDQLIVENGDKFTINEFHMWRGPQYNQGSNLTKGTPLFEHEQNLKLRLNYTFVNKYTKAIDRCCAYTLVKHLF